MRYKISLRIDIWLFRVFLFIFVLTSFNRELLFFGVDFRYVGFALEVFLLLLGLTRNEFVIRIGKLEKMFLGFYLLVLVSNLAWEFNDLIVEPELMFNLSVLNIYNFLAFLVFWLYKEHIDSEELSRMILISGVVLLLSMIWVYTGNTFPEYITRASRTMTVDNGLGEHHNLFGQGFRVAGFAEDANYATLFCVISIATALYHTKKAILRVVLCIAFAFGASISFSRTILLGTFFALLIVNIHRVFPELDNLVNRCFVFGTFILSIILPFLGLQNMLQTVSTRFMFWRNAADLFLRSPLIGNGLGAFRHYQSSLYNYTWYVQCHNTWWQILSEHGLIAAVLMIYILVFELTHVSSNYKKFSVILLSVFFCSCETVYLQIFVLIFYVIFCSKQSISKSGR